MNPGCTIAQLITALRALPQDSEIVLEQESGYYYTVTVAFDENLKSTIENLLFGDQKATGPA